MKLIISLGVAIAAAGLAVAVPYRAEAAIRKEPALEPFVFDPMEIVIAEAVEEAEQSIAERYSHLRGLRNNNAGNIRKGHSPWQGMAANQTDSAFVVFKAPEWGIRALGRTLLTYESKHGLNTVGGLISRWAPPSDNNPTAAYAAGVARALGVNVGQAINVRDHLPELIKAIIKHENGVQPYSDALINKGVALI